METAELSFFSFNIGSGYQKSQNFRLSSVDYLIFLLQDKPGSDSTVI